MVATVDYHSSGGYENLRGANPVGGVETMAMPQRDDTIEAIKRLDVLFEYAVMHSDEEEAERIREEENAWVQAFGSGRAVSDAFFNWLKNQHASEITKMFGNMSKKELEQLD